MNLFHLLLISVLALNFSGVPANKEEAEKLQLALPPHEGRFEDDQFIPWTDERKLSWKDFSGEPKRHSEAVASTSTSLGIAYQIEKNHLAYRITCNFSKHKSWGTLKTDYILAHEQGHFDITEIAARRLHEALSTYDFSRRNYKQDINAIYQQIVKEKEEMQAKYDRETDHSRNRKVQYEWLDHISNQLEFTAPWANYP